MPRFLTRCFFLSVPKNLNKMAEDSTNDNMSLSSVDSGESSEIFKSSNDTVAKFYFTTAGQVVEAEEKTKCQQCSNNVARKPMLSQTYI